MLASVSKLVDKPFIVGFILPVLLGAFALLALMRDLEPFRATYASILQPKGFTELTIAVLLLWVFAVMLLLLNTLLFRSLEGYFAVLPRKRWNAKKQAAYSEDNQQLRLLWTQRDPAKPATDRAYYDAFRAFRLDWPPKALVLPTRFGNVIRAFEAYPETVYGIDAIYGWLRLQAVISKEFEILVEDAHAQVSFFVNIWFFSLAFSVIAGGQFVIRICEALLSHQPTTIVASWGYLVASVIGVLATWLAYELAVQRARAWGGLIRSAFDVFLPELAKKMGYTLPSDAQKRRRFWQDITSSFHYSRPMPGTWIAPDSEPKAGNTTARTTDGASEKKDDKQSEESDEKKDDEQSEASDASAGVDETNDETLGEAETAV